jgi:phage shock protein C
MENTTTAGARASRLTRSASNRMFAGVCAGVARYFTVDPAIVRLLFVVFALAGGAAIPVYVVLWIVMPPDDGTAIVTIAADRSREALALGLVAVGGLWLLANLGAFRFIDWRFVWPLALVAIGVALLARRARQ